jgi:phosphoglycerate dehydrogenase-like enzyme
MPRSPPKTLIAITAPEQRDFFPAALLEQLRALVPNHVFIDPSKICVNDWLGCLREVQPEILVSCWNTPSVPPIHSLGGEGQLKYICHLSGSVRKLITSSHIESGLLVTNWGDSVSRVIAESGLFLTIAALRQATHWGMAMHQEGGWKKDDTEFFSLFERRVGLHGFGAVGQELARLMQPFKVRLQTYSPSVPDTILTQFGVERVHKLEQLFSDNEVLIELAPLTPKNKAIVNEEMLRRLRTGSVFVNIGRGAVVDEDALVRVAREGNIQFALDVFEVEPLPADSALRGLRNVTLLPHLSGPTTDRRCDAGQYALDNLQRYLHAQTLQALVTVETYVRST